MSKLKQKLKPKKKETFDSAEVKPLTEKESRKLSRTMILEWFKNHRWGKLKALQMEITEKTEDEKLDMKDLIIGNAKSRLDKLEKENRILKKSKEDELKIVERFADEITGISEEKDSIMNVLKYHQHKQYEEDLFFQTLDAYVGREKESRRLKNLIKKNVYAAKLMALVRAKNPKAMDEINVAINQGDYEKLKKALVKADSSISEKKVDYVFAAAMTGSTGVKEITGNKTVDQLFANVAKLRYIGHTYAMKKAAKDAGVSFWFVMRMGNETLSYLRSTDNRLQSHLALLQNKTKQTPKDKKRIEFIEAVNKMRKTFDAKVEKKGLDEEFKSHLDKHLDEKFKSEKFKKRVGDVDKDRLKAEIMANAKMQDLKLYQIFDLTYGSDEERSNLFWHSLFRGGALIRQFYKNLRLDEDAKLKKALLGYSWKRTTNAAIWQFRWNTRKWGFEDLQKEMLSLEARAKAKGSRMGTLMQQAGDYKIDANKRNITTDELYDRDMIVKKYHILAMKASKIMTKQAKPVIHAGKVIDNARRSHKDFDTKNVTDMNISRKTVEEMLGRQISDSKWHSMKGQDLVGRFGKRAVELKTMQEVTRARFAGLAEVIEENVETPFTQKKRGQMADIEEAKFRKNVTKKLQNIEAPSKIKKYGTRYALPAIIVGVQAGRLWTGNAKVGEAFWDLTEAGLGFVPVVGTALDFKAAFQGESLSGKKLSFKEQAVSFGFGCVGIVADLLTVVGGAGLGLRATIGGMRGTRRALQAGKAAGNLADAGHIAKAGPLNRIGGWFAGKFNEAERLEGATEAIIKKKATEQARHVSGVNAELKGSKIDSIDTTKNLDDEIARVEGELSKLPPKKKAATQRYLDKLKDSQKTLKGEGKSYLSMFEKSFGQAKDIPPPSFWRKFTAAGMWTSELFQKAKAGLLKIGVNKKAIESYEKTFDQIKALQKTKADKLKEIAEATKSREKAEQALRGLEALKKAKDTNPEQLKLIKAFEKEMELVRDKEFITKNMKKLAKQKKKLEEEAQILMDKNRHFKKLFSEEVRKKIARGNFSQKDFENLKQSTWAGGKVVSMTYLEFMQNAKKINENMKKAKGMGTKLKAMDVDSKDLAKQLTNLDEQRKTLQNTLEAQDKKALEETNRLIGIVRDSEGKMEAAQKGLSDINKQINNLSGERFAIRQRIEMKAETWMSRWDNMRRFQQVIQYGGMAAGAVYFFTDYKIGAGKQYDYVAGAAGAAYKVGGAAGHQLFKSRHGGESSIDEYIENKIHALEQKKKMEGIIAQAKQDGRSELEVLAANSNTAGAQEIIRKKGLAAKIAQLKAKNPGAAGPKIPARREIATGDSARKAGEKLRG